LFQQQVIPRFSSPCSYLAAAQLKVLVFHFAFLRFKSLSAMQLKGVRPVQSMIRSHIILDHECQGKIESGLGPINKSLSYVGIIYMVGSIVNYGYNTPRLFSNRKNRVAGDAQRNHSGAGNADGYGVGKHALLFTARGRKPKSAEAANEAEASDPKESFDGAYQYLTENMQVGTFGFLEKPASWEQEDHIKIIRESQKPPLTVEIQRHGVIYTMALSPKRLTNKIPLSLRYGKTCALEGSSLAAVQNLLKNQPKLKGPVRYSRTVRCPGEGGDLPEYPLWLQ
jgi:hypothetical protein